MEDVSHPTQDIIKTILEREHSYYLINAAPGSGKTTLLLELGRQLPKSEKALFVSFNRQNVSQLKAELGHKHGVKSTYALGLLQLSHLNPKAQLDKEKYQKLWRSETELLDLKLDDFSQKVLLQAFHYARLNLFNFNRQKAKALMRLLEPYPLDKTFEEEVMLHCLKVLFKLGIAEFKRTGAIDFTDMAALPYYLFAEKNSKQPQKWPLIAIDEAQDLSRAQLELILLSSSGTVILVGDEHQAVQGFAGALSNSIQQIRDLTQPHELSLPVSYRCPILHLELINQIYPGTNPRADAPFGEVFSVNSSEYLKLLTAGDMIIARSNRYLLEPCLKLQTRGHHAKILGLDGAERLRIHLEMLEAEPGFVLSQLPEFIERKIETEKVKAGSDPKTLMHVSMLEDQLQSLALIYRAAGGSHSTRGAMLGIIRNLFTDAPEGILFCTAHRSKGLEAQRVFIVYPEGMPNRLALEQGGDAVVQEENLRYVAISRAKQQLFFVGDNPSSVLHWIPEMYHEVWLEHGIIDGLVQNLENKGEPALERPVSAPPLEPNTTSPVAPVVAAVVPPVVEPVAEPVPTQESTQESAREISLVEEMYHYIHRHLEEQHEYDPRKVDRPSVILPFSELERAVFKEKRYTEGRIELIQGLEQHMFKMLQQLVGMEQQRLKLLLELFQTLEEVSAEVDTPVR